MKLRHPLFVCFAFASAAACGGGDELYESADECACGRIGSKQSGPATDQDTPIATSAQGLYGNRNFFWPAAMLGPPVTFRTDVQVCWENPNSMSIGLSSRTRASWRDARRRALEESWARHARINFVGWGTCTSGAPGVHIVICDGGNSDPRCPAMPASQAGGGFPAIYGLDNGIRMNPAHSAAAIVHEFGHALGFYHEEERYNPFTNLGTTACDTTGTKAGWYNPNPVTYGGYDQKSIMAYCDPPQGAPWLSYNDVTAIQRAYGRRQPGSLVTPRANCTAAHAAVGSGDQAFLWDCDEYANDQEYADVTSWSDGDAWNLQLLGSNYCLEPWSNSVGSNVALFTCSSSSIYYDWRFENMYFRGFGGLCLDLANGNTNVGTPIQVWECGALSGANQKWTRTRAGQIRYGTTNRCAAVNASTQRLELAACSGWDDRQLFSFFNGTIRRTSNLLQCLDVYGPSDAQYAKNSTGGSGLPSNGAPIQQFSCNGSMNQNWTLSGALRNGANAGLCLARGSDTDGSALSLASCSGDSETQEWDYYF